MESQEGHVYTKQHGLTVSRYQLRPSIPAAPIYNQIIPPLSGSSHRSTLHDQNPLARINCKVGANVTLPSLLNSTAFRRCAGFSLQCWTICRRTPLAEVTCCLLHLPDCSLLTSAEIRRLSRHPNCSFVKSAVIGCLSHLPNYSLLPSAVIGCLSHLPNYSLLPAAVIGCLSHLPNYSFLPSSGNGWFSHLPDYSPLTSVEIGWLSHHHNYSLLPLVEIGRLWRLSKCPMAIGWIWDVPHCSLCLWHLPCYSSLMSRWENGQNKTWSKMAKTNKILVAPFSGGSGYGYGASMREA